MPSSNEYQAAYQKKRYARRMAMAIELLGGRCVECLAREKLQLDHVDPETKVREVSAMTKLSMEKFLDELSKCQLLCGSCHRKKSAEAKSVPHGGGLTGKRNCRCDLCRVKKNKYQREKFPRSARGKRKVSE